MANPDGGRAVIAKASNPYIEFTLSERKTNGGLRREATRPRPDHMPLFDHAWIILRYPSGFRRKIANSELFPRPADLEAGGGYGGAPAADVSSRLGHELLTFAPATPRIRGPIGQYERNFMKLEMLKAKLFQARVTDANIEYEGSFGIDTELMEAVGLHPYEKVLISNINNGHRLETYVISEPFGSRKMVLNGAAARLGAVGDRVIIMAFCHVDEAEVLEGRFQPRILHLDENNDPIERESNVETSSDTRSMVRG